MAKDDKLNREIIADNIARDPVGSRLTPEAREKAIKFGVDVWKGDMGNGKAAQLGIKHATSEMLKTK